MNVLVANTGSSSLKLRLIDPAGAVLAAVDLPAPGADPDAPAIKRFASHAGQVDAVGHRLVHGGRKFTDSVVVDDATRKQLNAVAELAPLHDGPALAVLDELKLLCPGVPHVACFDTAFHRSLPDEAALYALPNAWIERFGLRRFGFHGLSHAWGSRRAAELLARPIEDLRLVTCHLGAGASLAAVDGGQSVDTTMGFTPNEGLVMATRSGSADPGMLLWLLRREGVTADELEHALEHESGLRGLSGTSGDMREVTQRADAGEDRARTALDVYVHRLRAGIAAMAAAMGGVDAVVFSGGVGENSPLVRLATCRRLDFLGVELDPERNDGAADEDLELSAPGARSRALLVHSREDLEIARSVRELLRRR